MYRWINSDGEVIKTASIQEFSEMAKMPLRSARALASGYRSKISGWCCTSRKTKKARERFMTRLVNTRTGQSEIVGQSATSFAARHGLCCNELKKLLNGHKIMYRGWAKEKTLALALGDC